MVDFELFSQQGRERRQREEKNREGTRSRQRGGRRRYVEEKVEKVGLKMKMNPWQPLVCRELQRRRARRQGRTKAGREKRREMLSLFEI